MNDLFGTLTNLILKPLNNLLFIISIFLCNSLAFCQISVNYSAPYDDVIFLVNDVLLSANLQTSNHDYSGHPLQIAYFNGELSNIGFNSGIVMSTNDVSFIAPGFVGPYDFVNQDPSVTDADLLTIANSVPDLIGQNFQVSSVNNIAILEFDINDFLEVRGVNIIDFEFSIYSRWSEQIFYTKDINHYWDGTFKVRLVPTGTYTYTISAYGKDAKMLRLNGHVNVIH